MLRSCLKCCLCLLWFFPVPSVCQLVSAPLPQSGAIVGTVEDVTGGVIPGAAVTIEAANTPQPHETLSDGTGSFTLNEVPSVIAVRVRVHADNFRDWISDPITLTPGQTYELDSVKLALASVEISVDAISSEELALEQVRAEEKQRLFGVLPNFYVAYGANVQPLPAKLKFQLAYKSLTDPATIGGTAFMAGLFQAANTPNYQQGLKGYGQRFGALYANGASDILIGGAILPSLLHQDPRYFYQGTGTNKSRALHALSAPFMAKTDSGRWQFNYSSIGGDLASGGLQNLYYPKSNRGVSTVFTGAALTTGFRMVNALAQEFLLHRVTSNTKSPE